MMDVKIQRHVKVRSNANPYLPEYKEYFEERKKWTKDCSLIQWKLDKKLNVIMDENLLGVKP